MLKVRDIYGYEISGQLESVDGQINGPGLLLFISPVGLDSRPRGARGLITITQISSNKVLSSDLQASNGGSRDVQEGST